jgi:putative membrane protein
MMKRIGERRWVWFFAAVIAPLLIVGTLLGAGSSAEEGFERIPVALVNNDELITEIDENGEETFLLASKPLVTELVTNEDLGFDWVITNSERAHEMLGLGEVYAVLEIPAEFSEVVQTLGTSSPRQASFTIRTDPSRSYLAGVLADALGQSIAQGVSNEFGKTITEGLFTVIVDLGDAFSQAADAAEELKEGTEALADGGNELATGTRELATGTRELADGYVSFDDGLTTYVDGVGALAKGITEFEVGTRGLGDLSAGVTEYTNQVAGVSALCQQLVGEGTFDAAPDPLVACYTQVLAGLGAGGAELSKQTSAALQGVRGGIVDIEKGATALSSGGAELASGSGDLRSGLEELATGTGELSAGVDEFASGISELDDGVGEFAEGLRSGSDELEAEGITVPTEDTLETLTNPVVFEAQEFTGDLGAQATLASVFIPLGLWFVSLVYFVMTPPVSRQIFASTVSTTGLMTRTLRPVTTVVLGHTAVVTLLIHALGGVSWAELPWSLGISFVSATAFSAFHYLLWAWRAQWMVPISVTLAVMQIVTLSSIVPKEILPQAYQALAGLTPVAWTTDAFLASVNGGDPSRAIANLLALAFLVITALVFARITLATRRTQSVQRHLGVAV